MAGESFRQPLLPGQQVRFTEGSTGMARPLGNPIKETSSMARLEGTGKDPLGRYGKGEVFDVPKYAAATVDAIAEGGEQDINPVYQELLDKGYAKEVKPEDDPARTVTQIADAMTVDPNATLAHPADAAVAEKIGSEADALAIVHTGDPKATAADLGDGTLKPQAVQDAQQTDKRQFGADSVLSDEPADGGDSSAKSDAGESRVPSRSSRS